MPSLAAELVWVRLRRIPFLRHRVTVEDRSEAQRVPTARSRTAMGRLASPADSQVVVVAAAVIS